MLPLSDPRWKSYKSGYHLPYDASIPVKKLFQEGTSEALWKELWNELHHQGDVDTASYAVVPYLIEFAKQSSTLDWNLFGLISVIELERPNNTPLPEELVNSYHTSIQKIPSIVAEHPDKEWDEMLTPCIVSCIALAKGQRDFARIYLEMSLESGLRWLKDETGFEP
ncbi:MAG: hypothetical protein AAF485_32755 [Chloroflexota bacterium]